MSWSPDDLLNALAVAGDDGLTHEQAEAALGVDADVNPRERTAVREALFALRARAVIGEPEPGVYLLVAEREAAA